jgi:hypothetical protein
MPNSTDTDQIPDKISDTTNKLIIVIIGEALLYVFLFAACVGYHKYKISKILRLANANTIEDLEARRLRQQRF